MRLGTGRERARSEVVLYCRRMLAESLVDFTAGNISVRVDGEPGLYAVTPSGAPYDSREAADVCLATIDGEVVRVQAAASPRSGTPGLAVRFTAITAAESHRGGGRITPSMPIRIICSAA